MSEWLEEAWKGNAMKQAELTNLTFTIHSVELRIFTDKETGKDREAYIARITLAGDDETIDAWLGGVGVLSQMRAIIERKAFPITVKQVKQDNAYKLISMEQVNLPVAEDPANDALTEELKDVANEIGMDGKAVARWLRNSGYGVWSRITDARRRQAIAALREEGGLDSEPLPFAEDAEEF